MDMRAFSVRDLQTAATLVGVALDDGVTMTALQGVLAKEIEGRVGSVRSFPSSHPHRCPTPGCPGVLSRWPASTAEVGMPVVGCLICRYSRIEEAE